MKKLLKALVLMLAVCAFALVSACGGGGGGDNGGGGSTIKPPTNVVATVTGDGQVTITFDMPSGAVECIATSHPGEATGTGSSPIVINGLANGTYNFSLVGVGTSGHSSEIAMSNEVTITGPVQPKEMKVNGTAGKTVIGGANIFIPVSRTQAGQQQNIYSSKFNQDGEFVWEQPVLATSNYDECRGSAYMDGFIYSFCVQDDASLPGMSTGVVFVEKEDASTGSKTETVISSYATPLGIIADPSTHTLYIIYGVGSVNWLVHVDANLNTLGSVSDHPSLDPSNLASGSFHGQMTIGPNALYVVGTVMSGGSFNRIKVFKFSKSLSLIGAEYYREFSDSVGLDNPSAIAINNDGSSVFVSGQVDLLGPNPRDVLLKVATATLSITSTDVGSSGGGFGNMAFDSSGTMFSVKGGSFVKVNVATMAITNLGIDAGDFTLDTLNGRLYVSHGDTVSVYDLSGNPL